MANSTLVAGVGGIATQVPTTGVNSITSLGNSINTGIGNLVGSIPQVPQYFFTVPFPNNQTVLYRLRIYNNLQQAGPAVGNLSNSNLAEEFIFPLTPNNITKQYVNFTSYYDVRDAGPNTAGPGGGLSTGVQRIVDQYGQNLPIITISGTTGFQFHSLDGYQWSGRSSFARLVQFITNYAIQVAAVTNSNQSQQLPVMQFTDGYTGEIFNVVPLGPNTSTMDVSKPIIQMYNIQLLVKSVVSSAQSLSLSQQDPIIQFFINTKALLTGGVLSWWNEILNNIPGSGTIA